MGKQNTSDWNKPYRVSVFEDESHRKIRSWRTSRIGLWITVVTFFVVTILFVYAVIAVTPLRTTIPGYPDGHFRREAVANAIKIDSLESAMIRWKLYTANLSRVLDGRETIDLDSIMSLGTARYLADKPASRLAQGDSLLRKTVEEIDQFGLSSQNKKILPLEGMHFFSPLKGVVSRDFDTSLHPYVDISAPAGSVIDAVMDGTVVYTAWSEEYGNTIIIQHPGDVLSIYSRNENLLKKEGDPVKAGSAIAILGRNTKLGQGDHLHFELWYKGEAVDPSKYISF